MNVKIIKVSSEELKDAIIRKGSKEELPSMHDNWRFNFPKHSQLPNATAYVLVAEETPTIIEGCLIFQMKEKKIPYMAFVEAAPHNRGDKKSYDFVAGCLIAFAFKQSYILSEGNYKGMLFFDVQEEDPVDEKKLMINYSKKYNAKIYMGTTMVIIDEDGDKLIQEYLERK
ncbi:MAG: hypothetical protein ABI091_03065 [Ferruginibacter sp.]